MNMLNIGDQAPSFTLPGHGGGDVSLADYAGRYVILYFYPKDHTPGCTKQACAFRDAMPDFTGLNAAVIGVSKDSVKKHEAFADQHDLPFPLVSDEGTTLCEEYGVWVEKNMYGKTYMGIERTTFLIAPDGTIAEIWRKLRVAGHVDAVKQRLSDICEAA